MNKAMIPYTLEEARTKLKNAIEEWNQGVQSYGVGSRNVMRFSSSELYKRVQYWQDIVNTLEGKPTSKFRRVIVCDR